MSDHHREHPMPNANQGESIPVRPGEQVRIVVAFSANNENCVQVYDQANGTLLAAWSNAEGPGGEWVSPRNMGGSTVILLLVSRHKDTPPDGDEPWHLSRRLVLDNGQAQAQGTITVGFNDDGGDARDADFNDARVTVIWLRPNA